MRRLDESFGIAFGLLSGRCIGAYTALMESLILAAESALRTLFAPHRAARACPNGTAAGPTLTEQERKEAAALMRVNHVGEVCAQALYTAQALMCRDPQLRRHFEKARQEETDHLAWTRQRLSELQDRPSLLNPIWYAGAFAMGAVAGRFGDAVSLGFVVETERQVESHLDAHLDRLPVNDLASRAIVTQMKADERLHSQEALAAGGAPLPRAVQVGMSAVAKVMTTTAHYI